MNKERTTANWGLTVLRLAVGSSFLYHGTDKLFHVGLGDVANYFGALHIPLPFLSAVVVTLVEIIGGVALLAGVFANLSAAFLAINMASQRC